MSDQAATQLLAEAVLALAKAVRDTGPPQVHVTVTPSTGDAPVVNVTVMPAEIPEVAINVPQQTPPPVYVTASPAAPPTVNVPPAPARAWRIERDQLGRMTGVIPVRKD